MLVFLLVLLAICVSRLNNQSIQPLAHFAPQAESQLKIEFDYPSSWSPLQDRSGSHESNPFWNRFGDLKFTIIEIQDPNLPAPWCPTVRKINIKTSLDFEIASCVFKPTITIIGYEMGPNPAFINFRLSEDIRINTQIPNITLVSNNKILIDGNPATVIIWNRDLRGRFPGMLSSSMYYWETNIYIHVGTQAYVLSLDEMPVEFLDGEFHQSFWEMIYSIKFVSN